MTTATMTAVMITGRPLSLAHPTPAMAAAHRALPTVTALRVPARTAIGERVTTTGAATAMMATSTRSTSDARGRAVQTSKTNGAGMTSMIGRPRRTEQHILRRKMVHAPELGE